jgi:hypothetical protein
MHKDNPQHHVCGFGSIFCVARFRVGKETTSLRLYSDHAFIIFAGLDIILNHVGSNDIMQGKIEEWLFPQIVA